MSLIKKSNELVIPTTCKDDDLRTGWYGKINSGIERTETVIIGFR